MKMSADPISISSFKAPAPGQADAIGVSGRRCLEPEDTVFRRAFVCVVFLDWFPGHHSVSVVGESMERMDLAIACCMRVAWASTHGCQ